MEFDWLFQPNALWVMSSSALLGVSSGVLGAFALLRRRSLVGDALAHAALPGIAMAFILLQTKSLPILLTGAVMAGLLGAWVIQLIGKHTRLKEDTALGIVLSVFFAVGIVLLTWIQHSGAGNQSGLDKFIFGQAASMVGSDVIVLLVCTGLVLLATVLLFKEFKLLCFDPQYARGIGFSPRKLDGLLMALIVLLVVVGMQAVGVVLMAAMLITPPAAARFWTDKLGAMVWISGIIGAMSGIIGTVLSGLGFRMATGPLIVIAASFMFAVSMTFAPRRGIIARIRLYLSVRKTVGDENVLRSMYELAEDACNWNLIFTAQSIAEERNSQVKTAARAFRNLLKKQQLEAAGGGYKLTEAGIDAAYAIVRKHRLWEMFLMHANDLDADHVHRDADDIEHFLSPEIIEQLEELLVSHDRDLKLPPSVHPFAKTHCQGGDQ